MAIQKDEAVVLRRLDYSETSQVLAFFGRQCGQVRLIAKGIKRGTKKAFATGIDLLEIGTLVFLRPEGRSGLGTLTEWRQTEPLLGLRADVRRLYAGQYAAEITSALTEEADPHPELFDAMVALLRGLAEAAAPPLDKGEPGAADPLPSLVRFQMQLLTSVGLVPVFDGCAACQRQRPLRDLEYFSAGQGGMVCRDCEPAIVEKRRVAPGVAADLARGDVLADSAAAAFDVLNYAISYAMGRPPKLAAYVTAQR
jgi:DNA repair protein RecO (recombination protein O)